MLELLKTLCIGALFTIVVMLVARKFWCWYFKIDERIRLLQEQNELLSSLNQYLIPVIQPSPSDRKVAQTITSSGTVRYNVTREIVLFAGPDSSDKIICRILKNETITVLDKKEVGDAVWYNVKDNTGNIGWCILDA
jgi:hypothetical protein